MFILIISIILLSYCIDLLCLLFSSLSFWDFLFSSFHVEKEYHQRLLETLRLLIFQFSCGKRIPPTITWEIDVRLVHNYLPQTKFGARLYFQLHVSKILFTGGSASVHAGIQPPPWSRPPGTRHPPDQTPPGADPPGPGTSPRADTPPRTRHPSPCTVHAGRYGQQKGSMHPTGMQSCFDVKTRWYPWGIQSPHASTARGWGVFCVSLNLNSGKKVRVFHFQGGVFYVSSDLNSGKKVRVFHFQGGVFWLRPELDSRKF